MFIFYREWLIDCRHPKRISESGELSMLWRISEKKIWLLPNEEDINSSYCGHQLQRWRGSALKLIWNTFTDEEREGIFGSGDQLPLKWVAKFISYKLKRKVTKTLSQNIFVPFHHVTDEEYVVMGRGTTTELTGLRID